MFKPKKIPFSSYGCWMSIVEVDSNLVLKNVRRYKSALFTIAERIRDEESIAFNSLSASPDVLDALASKGKVRFTWEDDRTLLIEARSVSIELSLHSQAEGFGTTQGDHYRFFSNRAQSVINASIASGRGEADFVQLPEGVALKPIVKSARLIVHPDPKGIMQIRIRISDFEEIPESKGFDFSAAANALNKEWNSFLKTTPEHLRCEHELRAWYNLWSSTLRAEGGFLHDGILMSKANMTGIWSWDHCFNGLAVALADSKWGIEQVRLPFSLQAKNGALPDVWQVSHSRWIYAKPPIHGWTLARILPTNYAVEDLAWLYVHIAAQTNWWFNYRDPQRRGLPESIHPNDGGWDNSTLFDSGQPTILPEIIAFLILQMEWLGSAATNLGLLEADVWLARSKELIQRLISKLWVDGQFCGGNREGGVVKTPLCLETCMPIILGKRLPHEIFSTLVLRISRDFLTPFGPATEAPSSPKYIDDGYWRGPIWAPSTYLIVEGLIDGGEIDLAKIIADRFCRMIERSEGFYENYSATDGRGLCDPGYTWTSAVYLLLKDRLTDKMYSSRDESRSM